MVGLAGIVVEATREAGAKARQVGAAIDGVHIVGKGKDGFGIAVGVLQGHLDRGAIHLLLDVERLAQHPTPAIEVAYERLDAALKVKSHLAAIALVGQMDGQATRKERHFAKPLGQCLEAIVQRLYDLGVGHKVGARSRSSGFAVVYDLCHGDALFVALRVASPVVTGLDLEPGREGVDSGDAHPMQAAGDLVPASSELAPRVQHRVNDLERVSARGLFDTDGDSVAIVLHRHRAVSVQGNADVIAAPC